MICLSTQYEAHTIVIIQKTLLQIKTSLHFYWYCMNLIFYTQTIPIAFYY